MFYEKPEIVKTIQTTFEMRTEPDESRRRGWYCCVHKNSGICVSPDYVTGSFPILFVILNRGEQPDLDIIKRAVDDNWESITAEVRTVADAGRVKAS